MLLKIMLTADVHLGLKFSGYPSVQGDLSAARFKSLDKIVTISNDQQCNLLVIAGDLFDHHRVSDSDIIKAASILQNFQGKVVAVLPGNHDFKIPGDSKIWHKFKSNAGDRTLLLDEKKVYPLSHYDLDANLYAAPCDSKHSQTNNIGWIFNEPKDPNVRYHLGVAHGSLEGVSPDPDKKFFPMNEEELLSTKLDLWLLGHTDRIQYPSKPSVLSRIFYPGTPEPNGFDCPHEGKVWIIEINDDKKIIPTSMSTGNYKFIYDLYTLNNKDDINDIIVKYANDYAKRILLKLKLTGRLPKNDFLELDSLRQKLEEALLYLDFDDEDLQLEITKELLDKEFTIGSFPYQVLTSFGHEEIDKEALQIAYELIQEVKNDN